METRHGHLNLQLPTKPVYLIRVCVLLVYTALLGGGPIPVLGLPLERGSVIGLGELFCQHLSTLGWTNHPRGQLQMVAEAGAEPGPPFSAQHPHCIPARTLTASSQQGLLPLKGKEPP